MKNNMCVFIQKAYYSVKFKLNYCMQDYTNVNSHRRVTKSSFTKKMYVTIDSLADIFLSAEEIDFPNIRSADIFGDIL